MKNGAHIAQHNITNTTLFTIFPEPPTSTGNNPCVSGPPLPVITRITMAIPRRLPRRIVTVAIAAVIFGIAMSAVQASPDQAPAPAPAPGPGVSYSDGATLDQGIACVLMLVALVLTYIIHAADATAGF